MARHYVTWGVKLLMHKYDQKVVVIRHGETEWSLNGRHTGVTDLPLTENGEGIAMSLQPILAAHTLTHVLTSPLRRARYTCELAGFGSQAEINDGLMEWNYGDYEGLTPHQIQERSPGWSLFRDGCPNGEQPNDVGGRIDHVIETVRAIEGDVALFSHGHVLRVFAARWLGFSPADGARFMLNTATMSVFSYYHTTPAVVTWNAPLSGY